MKTGTFAAGTSALLIALVVSSCSNSNASTSRGSSLCSQITAEDMSSLFSVRPVSDSVTKPGQLTAAEEKPLTPGGYGCKWTLNNNSLSIAVQPVSGGRSALSLVSDGPVDVGDGVQLYPPKHSITDLCLADLFSDTGPAEQDISIAVSAVADMTRPTPAPVDWCMRAVPAAKKVMKSISWIK